jgi:hypothetical protein
MVDPTGLSFAQPKGGLKRGETLADELNTKRPKAKEPITKEPKDRASQGSTCDNAEARSKRWRTTSAPQAAALAAEQVEAKRVASAKFIDEEEKEATRLRAKEETAEAARLVTARLKAEEKATAKLAAAKAEAARVAAEEEVVEAARLAKATAKLAVEKAMAVRVAAEEEVVEARLKAKEKATAKLAAEKTEAALVAAEEEVAEAARLAKQNLDHTPNKQRRVGASSCTLQRSATVVVERGLATKSRLAGSADEIASVGGRMRVHCPRPVDDQTTDRRRRSLMAKNFRRSAVKTGVLPSGVGDLDHMPRRQDYARDEQGALCHEKAFESYIDTTFTSAGIEARTLDQRDRKIGRFGDWMEETGHGKFVEWVQAAGTSLYTLEVVRDAAGNPRVPSVIAIKEFLVGLANCDKLLPKGGRPAYRSGPQYKPQLGKRQGDNMTEKNRGKYGWGAYAAEVYSFSTLEQYLSAFRMFYDYELSKTDYANPARNMSIKGIMSTLAKVLGRGRAWSPIQIRAAYVDAMWRATDLNNTEEVLTLFYILKGIIKGTRASDDFFLDWSDMSFIEASEAQRAGYEIRHVGSKNNREQRDKPTALACATGCPGAICMDKDGKWVRGSKLCPVHMGRHAHCLHARDAGVSCDELDCPVFSTVLRIAQIPSGATLVRSETGSACGLASAYVLVISQEQEARGVIYNRTVPFVFQGKEFRPPCRGTWFEVAGKGYAVHAFGAAAGVTHKMRQLMHKTNKRVGGAILENDINTISSRSLRITMATTLCSAGVPMPEIVENGDWNDEAMARKYIRGHAPLLVERRNVTDVALRNTVVGNVKVPSTTDDTVEKVASPSITHSQPTIAVTSRMADVQPVPSTKRKPAAENRGCCAKHVGGALGHGAARADQWLFDQLAGDEMPLSCRGVLCKAGYHTTCRDIKNWRNRNATSKQNRGLPPVDVSMLDALIGSSAH